MNGSSSTSARLRVLRSTGLLDSPPERAFDRLTRLASGLIDAPVALLSLVDERRQFFKSAIGLGEPWASRRETPLTHSFCQHVTTGRARLVVEDSRETPRLAGNLASAELSAIAYAGVPLMVEGEAIGALCVIDDKPRAWTEKDLRLLEDLAESIVSEIDLRLSLRSERQQRALVGTLLDSLSEGVLAVDPERNFLLMNQEARRIFAMTTHVGDELPVDWTGVRQSVRLDGTPLPASEGALARALRGETSTDLTFTVHSVTDGKAADPIWVEAQGRPVRDDDERIVAAVAVYRDVTARKQRLDQERAREAAMRQSEQVHRAIVRHLPKGAVFMVDRDLRYVTADGPAVDDMRGRWNIAGYIGCTVAEIASPANRATFVGMYTDALAGKARHAEMDRDGSFYDLDTVPIYDGEVITHALGFLYDVTTRKREADELRQTRDLLDRERELLQATLENIDDGVALVDAEGALLLGNRAFADAFGYPRDLAAVRLSREPFVEKLAALVADEEAMSAILEGWEEPSQEITLVRPRRRILRRDRSPVVISGRQCSLLTWRDITAEKDLLLERERLLLVDLLTGVPNRRAAEDALRRENERHKRSGTPLSVAVFDIDHFKRVNDTFGHAAGDVVLREVATALAGQARLTDTVARWGGEEFLAVLPVPLEGARAFCERARIAVERQVATAAGAVTMSVGVAELHTGESTQDAIVRADGRLYDAKREGRNRVLA